jgi:D-arabinose 1-dehydrogenase-like Zn-dependent alcohol dehydrogenase
VAEAAGLFAVQLAARGGAEVVATTRNAAARERLAGLGAHEVVASPYGDLFGDADRHDRSLTTFFLGAETRLEPDMTWLATEIHEARPCGRGASCRTPSQQVPSGRTERSS